MKFVWPIAMAWACMAHGAIAAQPPRAPARARAAASLSSADWQADLAYLDSAVREVHPAPFHRVGESAYQRELREIRRAIPRLSAAMIAVRFSRLVSLLNDGHSRLPLDDSLFHAARAFAWRIDRFADGIRLVAAGAGDSSALGMRVTGIGSVSATVAWDSLASLASGDNMYSRWAAVPYLATIPALLQTLGITNGPSLEIVGVTDRGDTIRLMLHAQAVSGDRTWFAKSWVGPGDAARSIATSSATGALSERHRSDAYWYEIRDHELYAQINEIANARDSVHLNGVKNARTFEAFSSELLAQIDLGTITRVILDIRYNDGGNNALVRSLVAGLAARPSVNRAGRLFVITGRRTYSAAMNFTSLLEDRTAAIFVGEPPGGSPRHYGDAVALTLPRSGWSVRLSTVRWESGVRPDDIRQVMEPGLPALVASTDLRDGRDNALEAIRSFTDSSVLSEQLTRAYRRGGLDAVRAQYASQTPVAPANGWKIPSQQLIAFAYATIPLSKSREDVFSTFRWVTEVASSTAEAWVARGQVSAFVRDWTGARSAYARALALRPHDVLIQRMKAVADRSH